MDPLGAPARLQSRVIWLLGQTSNQGHRLISERMHATGVPSRSYYPLLAALAETGATSQADLGRRIGLDRSDVTAAVTDLEGRGFLDRAPDPADRRRNLVRITAQGERFLSELDGHLDTAQEQLLAPLSPDERRALKDMLARLVAHHIGLPISDTEER